MVKSIGVSNYTVQHLKEMEQYASIMPHVLQVWYRTRSLLGALCFNKRQLGGGFSPTKMHSLLGAIL